MEKNKNKTKKAETSFNLTTDSLIEKKLNYCNKV